MASATRQALEAMQAELATRAASIELETARQLFGAARAIAGSLQLRALLADASTSGATKKAAVTAVFGETLDATALDLLLVAASQRWSSNSDLLDGLEELGIRAAALSAPHGANLEQELFAFDRAVSSDADLELAVSSKLGDRSAKVGLVETLFGGRATQQTVAIVEHLVGEPRGRRIGAQLRRAASIVSSVAGMTIATVTSARPVGSEQLARLQRGLSATFGKDLRINQIIDPAVIGGLRVQVGDEVIDGSVASRLHELKLQLAG